MNQPTPARLQAATNQLVPSLPTIQVATTERVATIGLLILVLLLSILGRSAMLADPGVFWHTVVGDSILRESTLPHVDQLTFTHRGEPWIAQQWLAETTMAALHRLGGLDALHIAACVLLAGVFATGFRRLLHAGTCWPAAALLTMLVIAATSHHLLVRPHLLTMALMLLVYTMLTDAESGRTPAARLYWLPLVFILWSNLHGGALGGLATLLIVALVWTASCIPKLASLTPTKSPLPLGRLWLIVASCLLAPFANPYGVELPRVWLSLMSSPLLPQMIQEHAAPVVTEPSTWLFVMLVAVYLLALRVTPVQRWRCTWLIPLVWAALGALRVRHAPLFAVLVPIAVAEMIPLMPWIQRLRATGSDLFVAPTRIADTHRSTLMLTASLVMMAALIAQTGQMNIPVIGRNYATPDSNRWPMAALPTLQAHTRQLPVGTPILNDMKCGGFISYYAPNLATTIDDRCELLGDEGLRWYANLMSDRSVCDALIALYDVRLALVRSDCAVDQWLRDDHTWTCAYRDATSAFYHRSITNPPRPDSTPPSR